MRVLFLSPFVWDAAYRGRYYHFLNRLVAQGHSVTVLEPRLSEDPVTRAKTGLVFARAGRGGDVWAAAAPIVRSHQTDAVIVTGPPRLVPPSLPGWWPKGDDRPRLILDYSDRNYLRGLGARLGPAGFLAGSLALAALSALARQADLVTVAREDLREGLPPGALLLPDPRESRWGRAPISGRTPALASDPIGGPAVPKRSLLIALLGGATAGGDLEEWDGLTARYRQLSFVVPGAGSRARLTQADVAVLLPRTPEKAMECLLSALTAGCPVLAHQSLGTWLAAPARAAELGPSDLAYYSTTDDLVEKLLRFSLTAEPARPRVLAGKAEKLRWLPVAEAFERAVESLFGGGPVSGVAGG